MAKIEEKIFREELQALAEKYNVNIIYSAFLIQDKDGRKFASGVAQKSKCFTAYELIDLLEASSRSHQFIREKVRELLFREKK